MTAIDEQTSITLPEHADPATAKVRRSFVVDGRIARMPTRQPKLRVLLELVM